MSEVEAVRSQRRRRSPSEISALYEDFRQSGLSLKDYCCQNRVSRSSLSSIVNRRRRPAGQAKPSEKSSFVPVEIIGSTPLSRPSPSALVVELVGRARVTVERDFDEVTLLRLLAVLGRV